MIDCHIFQCPNARLVTSCAPIECASPGVRYCPICRGRMPNPPIRNIIAEKAIENVPRKCV